MPDAGQWLLLAAIGIGAGLAVGWPLLRPRPAAGNEEHAGAEAHAVAEARALRHRIALESLLDVEADRRAGSLDDASYQRERAEAEARAAQTLSAGVPDDPGTPPRAPVPRGRLAGLAAVLAVALVAGFALPGSGGLGQRTVVNQALADQIAREADRQAQIQRLLDAFAANPRDAQVVSDLADAYLAGDSADDLNRAAVALQVLLALEPENHSAYRRLINAYIVTAHYADALATTDAYATIAGPDEPDIPFYRGLIGFRQGDNSEAVRQFDRFLALAPSDGRVPMVSSLRAEAAGALASGSPVPGG